MAKRFLAISGTAFAQMSRAPLAPQFTTLRRGARAMNGW